MMFSKNNNQGSVNPNAQVYGDQNRTNVCIPVLSADSTNLTDIVRRRSLPSGICGRGVGVVVEVDDRDLCLRALVAAESAWWWRCSGGLADGCGW